MQLGGTISPSIGKLSRLQRLWVQILDNHLLHSPNFWYTSWDVLPFWFSSIILFQCEPGHFTRTAYMDPFLMKLPIVLSLGLCKWKRFLLFSISPLGSHLFILYVTKHCIPLFFYLLGTWGLIISKEVYHQLLETFLISQYCKTFIFVLSFLVYWVLHA